MTRREKPATAKAEETRERIVDAALRLFREKGFDETTMRDIAAAAGVATGATYYYFRSKEELVMAFYLRTAEVARGISIPMMEKSTDLKKRIRAVIDVNLDQFANHRRLLVGLVRIGMDPEHPLSPFGKETEPIREEGIGFFRTAIEGSGTKVPKDLQHDLPRLLWMFQLGVMLFYVYDHSPGQRRTRRLVDGSLELIVRLIQLSGLPLMGPLRKRVTALIRDVAISD
ncbi:MAG TPA: TetR family transcriptional regulator [Thermoanaerobaculia bacterium]|nr:TetR family transcriptional regulator [Thermoanaerobaculia bacterium]